MILYEVFPNKTLKILEDEKTYITENLISSVHIKLPSTFGDYPVKELTAELRFYFPEGDYMAYAVDTQQARPEVPITNDITEKPQTLSVMLFFYKGGNVIGKTNSVDKVIYDSHLKGEPLTPRAEADEKIREQQATIAEQVETIAEQTETISSQGEQITELSGEVAELSTENAEQAITITRQNETIDQLLHRTPPLQQLDPINPSQIQQTYTPESPNIGFPQVIVNPVTAEGIGFNPDYYKEGETCVGKVGTYNPFPYDSDAGIYFIDNNEEGYPETVLVENWDGGNTALSFATDITKLRGNIRKLIFKNCKDIGKFSTSFQTSAFLEEVELSGVEVLGTNLMFSSCPNLRKVSIKDTLKQFGGAYILATNPLLKEVILPESLLVIGYYCFTNCYALEKINLPSSLTSIGDYAFQNCTSLTNLTIAQGFNCKGLNVSASTRFTAETIVSCLEALADRTGQTAYTITFGTTNLNKLTAEQKAIATNKNWNLA